jgi:hypothetical protein
MSTSEYLLVALIVAAAVVVYARYVSTVIRDINATPDSELQHLTRAGWIAVCVALIPIGGLIYLVYGRRR